MRTRRAAHARPARLRGPWQVNLHMPPWWRERRHATPKHLEMLATLQDALMARDDIRLSNSAGPQRPAMLGRRVWTLNYHVHFQAARNLCYKESYLPGFYTFDNAGYSGWSCNAGMLFDMDRYSADEARDYYQRNIQRRFFAHGVSKYAQVAASGAPVPQGCIFVALQVPGDSVLDLAWMDMHAMLAEALRRAPAEPVVIKLHPRSRSPEFDAAVRALHNPAGNVHVMDEPIARLIAAARVTVCINSGVGFEAHLRGGAVINCGATDYGTLTEQATTPAELAQALSRAEPPDPDLMRRHATWLFRDVFVDIRAPGWTEKVIRRLSKS